MKKRLAIIENHRKKAAARSRKCFESDCDSFAIDSHLLQKNGIINRIAEDRHVYEFAYSTFTIPYHLQFQRRGINKVFSFKGFCPIHDNQIFSPIEKTDFELTSNQNQLLFAYRSLVNEFRKKEIVVEYYTSLLTDPQNPIPRQLLQESIQGQNMGIQDGFKVLELLKANIHDPQNTQFIFYSRQLPRIDICACGVYTFETSNEINSLFYTKDFRFFKPLTDVFLTFLPFENHSILSIGFINGYNKKCDEYYHDLFNNRTDQYVLHVLSDILVLQLENWITSKTFYYDKIHDRQDKIIKLLNWAGKNMDERFKLKFNLFK